MSIFLRTAVRYLSCTLPSARAAMFSKAEESGMTEDDVMTLAFIDAVAALPRLTRWQVCRYMVAHDDDPDDDPAAWPTALMLAAYQAVTPRPESP